jgi:hypothetical protein
MTCYRKRLQRDVLALALPDGRRVGTQGHAEARRFVVRRMNELGLQPYQGDSFELSYTRDSDDFFNIIGVLPGENPSANPVLIGAHYDSVIDAPCADDNAAAVAIAFSAAKLLAGKRRERDVIIAIFDAEEPWHFQSPSMGSVRFYEDYLAERGVHLALIMDLMGHDVVVPLEYLEMSPWLRWLGSWFPKVGSKDVAIPGVRDLFFMTGAESHPALASIVESLRVPRRLRLIATLNEYVGDMSDHGVFRENGQPYLFLSCGRWRHYHMATDTPEKLNYAKMERMMRYLVRLAEAGGAAELSPSRGEPSDTTAFEIRLIQRACGLAFPWVMKGLGVKRLESREDIDGLARKLMSTGL